MTAGRNVNTGSVHWNTPPKYVDAVNRVLGRVLLDPCSNKMSIVDAKVELYENGLDCDWSEYETIFVNPPYGRGIAQWLNRCANTNSEIIALIPVAPNTKHWKDSVFSADCICFLGDTRLKFMIDGTTNNKGASMACCMVYWGSNTDKFVKIFNDYGVCVKPITQK
jgi:hypothetical protein